MCYQMYVWDGKVGDRKLQMHQYLPIMVQITKISVWIGATSFRYNQGLLGIYGFYDLPSLKSTGQQFTFQISIILSSFLSEPVLFSVTKSKYKAPTLFPSAIFIFKHITNKCPLIGLYCRWQIKLFAYLQQLVTYNISNVVLTNNSDVKSNKKNVGSTN